MGRQGDIDPGEVGMGKCQECARRKALAGGICLACARKALKGRPMKSPAGKRTQKRLRGFKDRLSNSKNSIAKKIGNAPYIPEPFSLPKII